MFYFAPKPKVMRSRNFRNNCYPLVISPEDKFENIECNLMKVDKEERVNTHYLKGISNPYKDKIR